MSQLYIPKKIKVGYQSRSDTYTKKLAYVIYYDDKGVLRKEKSWEGWRDKKIEAEEFDNLPQSGLVINKNISRYNWSHFSTGRTMIRVYDPRGIEFEITTENLIGVLMNSDCSKRGLSGEYVFAWAGTELVLLPTSSEEYGKATNYTALQGSKIGAKDMVPGCSYKTKKEEDLVYVGKFMWYEISSYDTSSRAGKKYHIFYQTKTPVYGDKRFITKSGLEFLACKNSDEIVSDYAKIVDKFKALSHSSDIVKWETVQVPFNPELKGDHYNHLKKPTYFTLTNNIVTEYHLSVISQYDHSTSKYIPNGYQYTEAYKFDTITKSFVHNERGNRYYFRTHEKKYTESEINAMNLCDLYIHLENGKKIKLDSLSNI